MDSITTTATHISGAADAPISLRGLQESNDSAFTTGCPPEFDKSVAYKAGDAVSRDGLLYKCKDDIHLSRNCKVPGYEPGNNKNDYWKGAWDFTGYCSGTITPTGSPAYVVLKDMGGCPDAWSPKGPGDAYNEGERVSKNGLVFACKVSDYYHCLLKYCSALTSKLISL